MHTDEAPSTRLLVGAGGLTSSICPRDGLRIIWKETSTGSTRALKEPLGSLPSCPIRDSLRPRQFLGAQDAVGEAVVLPSGSCGGANPPEKLRTDHTVVVLAKLVLQLGSGLDGVGLLFGSERGQFGA